MNHMGMAGDGKNVMEMGFEFNISEMTNAEIINANGTRALNETETTNVQFRHHCLSFHTSRQPSTSVLGRAVRVSGKIIDGVAKVQIVDVLAVALEGPILLAHADPLGLGRGVGGQLEHVQNPAELVASH